MEPDGSTVRLAWKCLGVDVPASALASRAAPERGIAAVVGQRPVTGHAEAFGRVGALIALARRE